jgi:hypothetical protein
MEELAISEAIVALLLAIIPATINRLLSRVSAGRSWRPSTRGCFSPAVRRTVPVRPRGDGNDLPP